MSQLKVKLREVLVKLSPELKKIKDLKARTKFYHLEYICSSKLSVGRACGELGVSEDYFRKWTKRLLKSSKLSDLSELSRKPRRSPKKTRKNVVKMITTIRSAKPFLGPERIHQRINEVFPNKKTPCISTVARTLKREGLISKNYRKKLTKKHLKRYRRPFCGYLQMDFKYVPQKIRGRQYYQLSAIDHHSDWRCIRIYDNKGFEALEDFLRDLETEVPFEIMKIQTDNDACFTDKFTSEKRFLGPTGYHLLDEWCAERDIEHKLIPVGEKELNGKVENSHKQDDREFFSQNFFLDFDDIKRKSLLHESWWNERRKTKARGWLTPTQAIKRAYIKALALLTLTGKIKENGEGRSHLKVPKKDRVVKSKNRTRKLSAIERYLNYCEGMARFKKR
jgi:transposase InsO family protein